MNKHIVIPTGCLILALSLVGCSRETASTPRADATPAATNPAPATSATSGTIYAGKVVETMNSGGYTYVNVDTGKQSIWAAAPQFKVKVGDAVTVPPGMPMEKFHSSTLNRDFDVVYFVDRVTVGHGEPAASAMPAQLPKGHPPITGAASQATLDFSGLKKAEGGNTVAEIFAAKADLKGKEIKVRGKVVKFNANIMGKNWLHLEDGTGAAGTNDLTVTTSGQAKVGDTVLVTGKLATDKDFGYNYQYPVLVEDATVVVE